MTQLKGRKGIDWTLIGTLILLFFGYLLLFDLTSGENSSQIFAFNTYDSYSLQAQAWLEGRTTISSEYSWLELAIYNGEYYVSFPPFPSVVMLPLVMISGGYPPSNLVLILTCLTAVACAYECFRHIGAKEHWAALWAVFYVMGSNMVSMTVFGGVWFLAQGMNLALATGAVWALLCGRKGLCLALLALAVGCRPFSICMLGGAWLYFVWEISRETASAGSKVWRALRILIVPAVIGCCYMAYNQVRFGSPFEFGHNYLPEFTEAEHGQFDLRYVGENLYNILLRPVGFDAAGSLVYPQFDGFMFYLANPLFLVWFGYMIGDIIRRRFHWQQGLIVLCFALNLLLLTAHKTFGGWQFGARYTVDLLPYALIYLLAAGVKRPNRPVSFIAAAAVMFNAYGAVALFYKMGF